MIKAKPPQLLGDLDRWNREHDDLDEILWWYAYHRYSSTIQNKQIR